MYTSLMKTRWWVKKDRTKRYQMVEGSDSLTSQESDFLDLFYGLRELLLSQPKAVARYIWKETRPEIVEGVEKLFEEKEPKFARLLYHEMEEIEDILEK